MGSRLSAPPLVKRAVARSGHGRRINVGVVRYRLRVSKPPTFPELIADAIEQWYASDSDFARRAGVSSSAVSRWIAGTAVPTVPTLEKIAPHLRIDAPTLIAIAYPGTGTPARLPVAQPLHPLARDIDRLLDEKSGVPAEKREALATLIEHVVAPYRHHLRKRRAS